MTGNSYHGYVAGIITLATRARRLPGDPVHAETFDFPVCHTVVDDVTIRDLISLDPAVLEKTVAAAEELESRGCLFIATSCGLFAPYQTAIADRLKVPFIGSSLQAISFLRSCIPARKKVCIVTAHSGIITDDHLNPAGFGLEDIVLVGMQDFPEFVRTVIEGEPDIDENKIRQEVQAAAKSVKQKRRDVGLIVLECPNLISFRREIQEELCLPVLDIASLIDLFASACRLKTYSRQYVQPV